MTFFIGKVKYGKMLILCQEFGLKVGDKYCLNGTRRFVSTRGQSHFLTFDSGLL